MFAKVVLAWEDCLMQVRAFIEKGVKDKEVEEGIYRLRLKLRLSAVG